MLMPGCTEILIPGDPNAESGHTAKHAGFQLMMKPGDKSVKWPDATASMSISLAQILRITACEPWKIYFQALRLKSKGERETLRSSSSALLG